MNDLNFVYPTCEQHYQRVHASELVQCSSSSRVIARAPLRTVVKQISRDAVCDVVEICLLDVEGRFTTVADSLCTANTNPSENDRLLVI